MIFDPVYFLFALPGIIFALIAQAKVRSAYEEASNVRSHSGLTGADVAKEILKESNITDVKVEPTQGLLSDHYHPIQKALRLSEKNYYGDSLAALGVAAHEVGHAIQHKQKYAPLVLRSTLVPVASFGSNFAFILFAIGLFMSGALGNSLMVGAIFLFSAAVLFAFITLPVEFDASRRAVAILSEKGIISGYELGHVKKVLNAAALTYIAGAVQALLILLYFISRYRQRS
jgi:hypothetical protein